MEFDLDQRTAALGVGELSAFAIGPRDAGDGTSGVWRAQLGTRWHQELRAKTAATTVAADFEATVAGQIFHGGWTLTLTGRIDQVLPATEGGGPELLREIKTVLRPLPVPEAELRADYPGYFAQLAAYVALRRLAAPEQPVRAELLFVEAGSGLGQTVGLTPADDGLFRARLAAVTEFLTLRLRARERLRALRFRPAFHAPRDGQETTCLDLATALQSAPGVLFEAPTGFGKTGVLLECALAQLRAGRFSRVLYLTSKSTGQLHVVHTLQVMTAVASVAPPEVQGVAIWHVRNKREHCINPVFHCTRDACVHLADLEARWPRSGLARFYLDENMPRDLDTLRAAGREARLCPYEITRAALAFNDVWVGDYNYVFAPGSGGIFYDQPGFDPGATLLLIDEAHNLPARVADAHSHAVLADDLRTLLAELEHQSASRPLQRAVEALARLVAALRPCDALDPAQEDDLADALATIAAQIAAQPPDHVALGPHFAELLWQLPVLDMWLREGNFPRLLWSPRAGELRFTCLDASALIGETVRAYGGVIFATATPGPPEIFAAACGLQPSC
ncbi:MAG: helicase, partial [Verrucomicrobiota bacterium]